MVRATRNIAGALAVVLALVGAAACDSGSESEASAPSEAVTAVDEGARTHATSSDGDLTIETTSARAAFVSAGDVLVTVSGAAAGNDAELQVTRNGEDVSDRFEYAGELWRGLVDGLRDGKNQLEVEAGSSSVSLEVVNHPKNGPMFAGAHLEPWVCTTEAAGLGKALDDDCDAESKTTWSYRAKDGTVKPLPTGELPADIDQTEVAGTQVPFVIRTETGVIDRGVYTIWALDPDHTSDDGPFVPTGWNERLVFRFGGGCGTQYSQGVPLAVELDTDLLERGYAVATNTLDTFQTACNDELSAEAAMMTREHFVEQYGVPQFTIGDGGSGGAIQQLLIAANYPGVLDGLSPSVPFPDAASIAGGVTDCGLLVDYYKSAPGNALTPDERAAINGHQVAGSCEMWDRLFVGGVNPTDGCDPKIADQVYDAEKNPDGVRCTLADMNVAIFGRDPETGFARRALDNVGIQYGLDALQRGAIDVDQFLDVNEHIGGYDIDGNIVAARAAADEDTMATAYRTGRVTGAGPLLDVPIILRNVDTDPRGDIHTRVHVFSIRDRLTVDGRDDPNLLLWISPAPDGSLTNVLLGSIGDANAPIVILDEWLTAAATTGDPDVPIAERLAAAKPKDAVNRCVLPDGKVVTGGWELYDDAGPCRDAYPIHEDPRMAAGQPRRGDTLKCALTDIDRASYDVTFTDAQFERLQGIFPDGVCDWAKPGLGQVDVTGTWQTFNSPD